MDMEDNRQPSMRKLREESESDAKFTVYLKKVHLKPKALDSTYLNVPPNSDTSYSTLQWETIRVRTINAATLKRLVEAFCTADGHLDTYLLNVFLATYRTFATTDQVLDLLLDRYEKLYHEATTTALSNDRSTDDIHRKHMDCLIQALHMWLEGYPEDWITTHLERIIAFTSALMLGTGAQFATLNRLNQVVRERATATAQPLPTISWQKKRADIVDELVIQAGLLRQISSLQMLSIVRDVATRSVCREVCAPNPGGVSGPASSVAGAARTYRFPNVSAQHFAGQLTRMDVVIFRRLLPHQCLGATYGARKKRNSTVQTAVAMIDQFNAVVHLVGRSILQMGEKTRSADRAASIAMWIDIAKELRVLKNFSSLKAVVASLQWHPVHRLKQTWKTLDRKKMEIFNELEAILSVDRNQKIHRDVLNREGTAKFAVSSDGHNDSHLNKILQSQNVVSACYGTIPYLGMFLTDLEMLHAGAPDLLPDTDLINFDKKRKEFEKLAELKLLQVAANSYRLSEDPIFDLWFAGFGPLSDEQAYELSYEVEPMESIRPKFRDELKT